MMGENPNYWRSLNGKLQPPPSHQVYPTFLSTPPLPVPVPPPSSIFNPPYLFGSSLLLPAANSNALAEHHHHDNQDFPVSWSQLLLTGVASDHEHNLGDGHVGEVKHGFMDQQSRQLYYGNRSDHHDNNNNEEDVQTCSSSWSSQRNPVASVGSASTMSLSTSTMFDFSSKMDRRNHHTNQYSTQYDDTSTSGASKKPKFQSSSTHPSPMPCSDTFTSGTSKRSRAQHSTTQTPLKVRKEKLGDRISALHQLVSPFGKTDTASVLFEATAHIRFLEGQIEALSSPYMNFANNVSGGTRHQHSADGKAPQDLASRGLCLVPVTCIDHMDTTNMTSNGAEFWTPAFGGGL